MPAYNYPSGMTELVLDTTRAIHNLLWNGTFGKFPNIKWILPHGGGTVPFLLYRMSAMNDRPKVAERLPGGSVAARVAPDVFRCRGDLFARTAKMLDGIG